MFTCISCRVAFEDASEQRAHFTTDWHRYNMKRRVANLPPVPALSFNEKVIERREQNAVKVDPRGLICQTCNKTFSTENAYRSHIDSKKHLERERAATAIGVTTLPKQSDETEHSAAPAHNIDNPQGSSTELEYDDITTRLASARRRIQPTHCLFCSHQSPDINSIVQHMSRVHSFFIPEREHLLDLPGLLGYLGEKVVVGNLCLFCPNGGREFSSLEAVRRHMVDKSHCKMAFETDEDVAETSDYYDWHVSEEISGSEWEDAGDVSSDDAELLDDSRAGLSADGLSLTLPSGRVIGHRSLRVYYSQQFRQSSASRTSDPNTLKVHRIRQLLADPTQAMVPVAGGTGAFGRGLHVVKARNAGEAAWVRKQARSFRDQRVREDHKTRVGYIHNSQKHFRDPLLQ